MKPEPLKGKIKPFCKCDKSDINCGYHLEYPHATTMFFVKEDVFKVSDVKSAVEWLLQEIEEKAFIYEYGEQKHERYYVVAFEDIEKLIKKAFADVIKKEKQKV